ncbi:MAG: bifunctional 4-hydroxy-2-oxoglutarate aldolase/2-dehydro-3-deoxy-phosphogluconate aldolase [Acidobacteriota bacterium]
MAAYGLLKRFFTNRIVVSLRATTAEMAVQAARAVIAGGIRLIEIPHNIPGAMRVIGDIRHQFADDVTVGIGDVPTIEVADRAIKANVQFVTLPYDNQPVMDFCRKHHVLVIPSGATPREVARLAEQGLQLVRVFPVAAFGGAIYVGHLRRTIPNLHLLAAGGIDLTEVTEYCQAGASVVTIGSGLFLPFTGNQPDLEQLTQRAEQLSRLSLASRH